MCGLFGVFSNAHLSNKERDAFVDLSFLSTLRGVDSAGIIGLTKKKVRSPKVGYEYRKKAVNPVLFFLEQETINIVYRPHTVCLMGHSRWANQGSVNDHNAHPVEADHIIGMHNGLARKYSVSKWEEDKTTDSRKLYEDIVAKGLLPTLANLYSADAYALTYFNKNKCTLNIIRNKERPLVMAETDGACFWASEARMLDLALPRNGIKINRLVVLDIDTWYQHNFLTNETVLEKVDLSEYKEKTVFQSVFKPKEKADFKITDNRAMSSVVELRPQGKTDLKYIHDFLSKDKLKPGYLDGTSIDDDEWIKEFASKVEAKTKEDASVVEDSPFHETPSHAGYYSPNASYRIRMHGKEEWVSIPVGQSYLRHGCHSCNGKSSVEDVVYWVRPSVHYCEDCINYDNVKEDIRKEGSAIKSELINLGGRSSVYG